jgi:hypothetical protein
MGISHWLVDSCYDTPVVTSDEVTVVFCNKETVGSVASVGATTSGIKKGGVVVVAVREGSSEAIVVEVNRVDDSAAAVAITVDPGSAEAMNVGGGAVSFAAGSSSAEELEGAVSIRVGSKGLTEEVATMITVGTTSLLTVARDNIPVTKEEP